MTARLPHESPPQRGRPSCPCSNWNTGAVRSREAMRLLTDEIRRRSRLERHPDRPSRHGLHQPHRLQPCERQTRPAGRSRHQLHRYRRGRAARSAERGGGLVVTPGHGTRTLGALCGNLPGIYIGVCPTVPVVPYRVTNGVMLTGQTILNAANAIMDAVDRNLADVISISLGVQSIIGNHQADACAGPRRRPCLRTRRHHRRRGRPDRRRAAARRRHGLSRPLLAHHHGRRHQCRHEGLLRLRDRPPVRRHLGAGRRHLPAELGVRPARTLSRTSRAAATARPTQPSMSRERRRCGCASTVRSSTTTATSAGSASRRSARCCASTSSRSPATACRRARARPIPASWIASRCSTNKLPPLAGLKKAQLAEPEVD